MILSPSSVHSKSGFNQATSLFFDEDKKRNKSKSIQSLSMPPKEHHTIGSP